ncbi:hypothetical protein [Roseisalinus antarcticus]|uniref:Lipoprotein n=1 Tax=Roseisalinus antarcticus TaxID=254357 RepID=A0A1Y5TTW3_9RHOB|nr:hypothetical protein [Roseisalinus antarcticus]SLN71541.1 hypothetical protein ROA7023_03518 [Roseisalinus antarcticus]
MRIAPISVCALCAALSVSGCGQLGSQGSSGSLGSLGSQGSLGSIGSLNPFGGARRTQATVRGPLRPLVDAGTGTQVIDGRALLAQVTDVRMEPAAFGAIVTASGLAYEAGNYNAQLTREGFEGGTLVLAFRAERAAGYPAGGPAPVRRITSAITLDEDELSYITGVRVVAQGNAVSARR